MKKYVYVICTINNEIARIEEAHLSKKNAYKRAKLIKCPHKVFKVVLKDEKLVNKK